MKRLGVIGGTGLIAMTLGSQIKDAGLTLIRSDSVNVETAWGEVPLTCMTFDNIDGETREIIFLQRHHNGEGSNKPPHPINHRANLMDMKDSG